MGVTACRAAPAGRRHSARDPTAAPGLPCERWACRDAGTLKTHRLANASQVCTVTLRCGREAASLEGRTARPSVTNWPSPSRLAVPHLRMTGYRQCVVHARRHKALISVGNQALTAAAATVITRAIALIAKDCRRRNSPPAGPPMPFEIPTPSMTFEVAARGRRAASAMRRHGNPDGVRLLVTHGNGFAADAYYPYWRHLLAISTCWYSIFATTARTSRPIRRTTTMRSSAAISSASCRTVRARLPQRPTAGIFHSMSGRTAMKHAIEIGWRWDALRAVRSAERAAAPAIRSMRRWRCSRTG